MKWVVLVALASAASVASAAPRTAQLSYAGDVCAADDLVDRVRELVGRDPFVNDDAALRIEVHVDAGPRATVTIARRGQRKLVATTCGELMDALALVIAIDVFGDQPTLQISAPVPQPVIAVSEPPRIGTVAPQPEAPRTLSLIAGLAASTHGSRSGSVGAQLERGWWSIEGVVRLGAPETHPMVDVVRGGVTAAACMHVGSTAACPMVSAGWVMGSGRDLVRADTAMTPAAAAGMRLAVAHALVGAFGVRARIDGTVSMTSTTFTVDDSMVWESPRGELAFGIDVLARIP